MKPVISLVGRPNVGKSTLFNRMTRSRDAIVVDVPGVTRDRHYGDGRIGSRSYLLIDTGGLEPGTHAGIFAEMARQTEQAIAESDAVVFVVDARAGVTGADREIAQKLRRLGVRVFLAANKAEGLNGRTAAAEFHELGLGEPMPVSGAHGEGVREMMDVVLAAFPAEEAAGEEERDKHPRFAIVGRPNVGKSTLVNALVGEERVIAFDQPGTTRDTIEVRFERDGKPYTLIDTAGLRKRGKQEEAVEKFSVVRTLQAIEASNVSVLMLDATEGVTEQDAHIAGFVLERGRAVVLAINKWDAAGPEAREKMKRELAWKLDFLGFADAVFLSAKTGKGLGPLMKTMGVAYDSAMADLSTPRLTRALIAAVERQAPPRKGLVRPKLRYAHQGGRNPPCIVIHGNALQEVPDSYRRYLEGYFRKAFELRGTPMAIQFRTGRNPFQGRKGGTGR